MVSLVCLTGFIDDVCGLACVVVVGVDLCVLVVVDRCLLSFRWVCCRFCLVLSIVLGLCLWVDLWFGVVVLVASCLLVI